jgi:hypothetical protein
VYKILSSATLVMLLAAPIVSLSQPAIAGEPACEQTKPAAQPTHVVHKDGVHEEILIKASPKVVWESMQTQRKLDPDSQYCKAIGEPGNSLVEQKFKFPSPFGDAECILHLSETPAERVDFKLIESEELKKMEGCWTLTPVDNGTSTKLGLSSYVEPHMCIPRMLTNGIISHKAKKNLAMVKKLAEKSM